MPTQEKLNTQGREYIERVAHTVRLLWRRACEAQGTDPGAKFVIFADDNKFKPFYDKAMTELLAAKREYAAGGYVGLQIGAGGKAR